MKKTNCWQFKKCDRHPGGEKVPEPGVCVAAFEDAASRINKGEKGGRACWALAGIL